MIAGIPCEEIRHTRAVQDWLAEGRQEGEARGEAIGEARGDHPPPHPPLRPPRRSPTAQIQTLPLEQLEALADALLDSQGPADLTAWLAANA